MDILDALRLASSADLYRLHLTVARLLDDPKRIIEIRRHLNLGLVVSYIADDIHATQRQGQIVELKTTQAVLIDSATHLKRMIELNVGDEELLHRELEQLLSEHLEHSQP